MRRYVKRFISLAGALSLVLMPILPVGAAAAGPTLISLGDGNTLPNGPDYAHGNGMTPDGRYLAFYSLATNLTSDGGNNTYQTYVHDQQTGATTLASVNNSDVMSNQSSRPGGITPSGRYILFDSGATNLNGPAGQQQACYIRDLRQHTTSMVPSSHVSSDGCLDISDDGNYVAFDGYLQDGWPGYSCPQFPCNWQDPNDYILNRSTSLITPVAIDSDGNYGAASGGVWHSYNSNAVDMSGNGNLVAFVSVAPLMPGLSAGTWRLYVRNMTTNDIQLIPAPSGSEVFNPNTQPKFSSDGRYIVYTTMHSNGTPYQVYLRNLQTGVNTPVDVTPAGGQANGPSFEASINPDGSYVAFRSQATNLVTGGSSSGDHVFVRNMQTDTTTQADVNSAGQQANGGSNEPSITSDGRAAFYSYATNLTSDNAPAPQVYLSTPPVSVPFLAINAGGGATGNFVADTGFLGGSPYTSTAAVDTSNVTSPAPQAVYQSVRYGNTMGYSFAGLTPNANYTLRFDFNELYWGTSLAGGGGVGSRVFNVAVNGQSSLANYDIYQKAGGANKAITEQVTTAADASGIITIQFTTVTDNAMVNGIELYNGTLPPLPPPPTPTPATSALINAGGNTAGSFVADADYLGGTAYASAAAVDTTGVANPAPQGVYQSVRYGNFTYSVPNLTPNTNFLVRLHFNELYWGTALAGNNGGAGSRVFNVSINNTQVLSNYDIFAAAGGANKAVVQEFTAVSDAQGRITIQFGTVTDNAMVNGIEIVPPTTP